jgi:Flp pilus assembly protein TadG
MTFIHRCRDKKPKSSEETLGFWTKEQGQSLMEVAILVPLFTLLVCYAVDFGYFYIVAASLSSSARNAAEYSIQGYSSASQSTLPAAGPISVATSVAALAMEDLSSFYNSSISTSVEICSDSVLTNTNSNRCASYGPSTLSYAADTDPENAFFHLNRVDVVYTISPPIPLGFLGTSSSIVPSTFRRTVEMRAIN